MSRYACYVLCLVYILYIERPSADAPDPNPEHVHPDRLQVTSGGPRNQPRNDSIVQAHPVQTLEVLGEVLEGSLGVPWRSLRLVTQNDCGIVHPADRADEEAALVIAAPLLPASGVQWIYQYLPL